MEQIQDFESLQKEITANPKEFVPEKCIQFLQAHEDAAEKIGNFIFNIIEYNYELNSIKKKIFTGICLSLPSIVNAVMLPYFQIPNSISSQHNYRLGECNRLIKQSYIDIAHYTYEQLATILNQMITKPLYENITVKFFISQFPDIQPFINKELLQLLNDLKHRVYTIVDQFKKPLYVPSVVHCDSTNPRISKFGGAAPYLPTNGPIICPCESDKLQTVFSLYVPSLPNEIQELFPKNHEFVVVGYTCNSCYEELEVKLYCDDEIDQLVYDDVPSFDNIFNDARKVVNWSKSFMYPTGLVDAAFELPNKESYSEEEIFFIDEFLNNNAMDAPQTYLGGYPIFIQGDDSPPGCKLLLEMAESEAATNMWGDCGTCQVWMTVDDNFGDFIMQYNCS